MIDLQLCIIDVMLTAFGIAIYKFIVIIITLLLNKSVLARIKRAEIIDIVKSINPKMDINNNGT